MICYTYDYELFFRESGTIENCLIKPTNKILDFFKKHNQSGTFFVDALFLEKLQSINQEVISYNKIISQLHRIILEGSRIELHIHTHWLDAEYNEGQWVFINYDRYRVQSLSKLEIQDVFNRTTKLLNTIARKVDPNYSVRCFRAGGWCIQPFDDLYDSFINNGLVVDSSLAIGISESNVREYNFDNDELEKREFWDFRFNPLIEVTDGEITEIPIHTIKRDLITRIIRKITLDKGKKYGDGKGLVFTNQISKIKLFLNWFKNRKVMFSTDDISKFEINIFLKKYNKDRVYIVINHPKSLKVNSGLLPYEKFKNIKTITLYEYYKIIEVKKNENI